jgi:anti-sigma regulatory factor (Ser/Thr protein kinase)
MQDELVIELYSELSDIARLAGQVEIFGVRNDVPELAIAHVNLSLDELLTNSMSHGVVDPASHRIQVTLRLERGRLLVEVLDNGKPFAPFERSDPDLTRSLEGSDLRAGWTAGGGFEYILEQNWSVRLEYRYTDLGEYSKSVPLTSNCGIGSCSSTATNAVINLHPTDNTVRVGLALGF